MNISFISAIIVAIACVGLALIPILNNTHRVSNRLFFVLGIITGIYTLTNILADRDQVRALLWVRLTFVLATAIVLLMVLFLSNFPAKIVRIKHQFMLVFLSICMGIITLLPSFIPLIPVI